MKKEKNPKRRVPQQGGKGMVAQMQTSVEIISLATVICKCSEKDYVRLFIREPEVKAREGKMAYVRPEYHDRIMRIIRVIGHGKGERGSYPECTLWQHCKPALSHRHG